MLSLEIFCNMIYKEGVKYIVSIYNFLLKPVRSFLINLQFYATV